jgi:antitoxin component YwqK of YwqJK toxin-antitoxin module
MIIEESVSLSTAWEDRHGTWRGYNDSRTHLRAEWNYDHGVLNGTARGWFKSGELSYSQYWVQGIIEGEDLTLFEPKW